MAASKALLVLAELAGCPSRATLEVVSENLSGHTQLNSQCLGMNSTRRFVGFLDVRDLVGMLVQMHGYHGEAGELARRGHVVACDNL